MTVRTHGRVHSASLIALLGAVGLGCSSPPVTVSGQLDGEELPAVLSGFMWRGPDSWNPNYEAIVAVRLRNTEDACEGDTAWELGAAEAWDRVNEVDDLEELADRLTELDRDHRAEEDLTLTAFAAVRNAAVDDQVLSQADGTSVGYVTLRPGWVDWHAVLLDNDGSSYGSRAHWTSASGSVYIEDLVRDVSVTGSAGFDLEDDGGQGLEGDMSLSFDVEHCDGYRLATSVRSDAYEAAVNRLN